MSQSLQLPRRGEQLALYEGLVIQELRLKLDLLGADGGEFLAIRGLM